MVLTHVVKLGSFVIAPPVDAFRRPKLITTALLWEGATSPQSCVVLLTLMAVLAVVSSAFAVEKPLHADAATTPEDDADHDTVTRVDKELTFWAYHSSAPATGRPVPIATARR